MLEHHQIGFSIQRGTRKGRSYPKANIRTGEWIVGPAGFRSPCVDCWVDEDLRLRIEDASDNLEWNPDRFRVTWQQPRAPQDLSYELSFIPSHLILTNVLPTARRWDIPYATYRTLDGRFGIHFIPDVKKLYESLPIHPELCGYMQQIEARVDRDYTESKIRFLEDLVRRAEKLSKSVEVIISSATTMKGVFESLAVDLNKDIHDSRKKLNRRELET